MGTYRKRGAQAGRDEGSVLVLALIMMVLGSLIVASLASYATTVLRTNRVVSERTQRTEAVKAGLRMAMANPRDLYEYCGPDNSGTYSWVTLAPITLNGITVSTRCHTIDVASSQSDDERRFGLADTMIGQEIPIELTPANPPLSDPGAPPTRFDMTSATDPASWLAEATETSVTGKIFRPRLPSHGVNPRSASGTKMPAGWPECRIFFPGTYIDPVLIDSRTFFTSGVYYFEKEVRVVGGADVVVGDGNTPACVDEVTGLSVSTQDALYYAETVPGEHYVNGYGATFVFGERGRLVISNDPNERNRAGAPVGEKPISFIVNRRYNKEGDYKFLPSSDVSIITVDGENNAVFGTFGGPLEVPGLLHVPESIVGADDPTTDGDDGNLATAVEYRPSVYTPKPRQPEAPGKPTVVRRGNGEAIVSWAPPPWDGGASIVRYEVTPSAGTGCVTRGATTCRINGLTSASNVTFTVVAYNHSDPSDPAVLVASPASLPSDPVRLNANLPTAAPSGVLSPQLSLRYDEETAAADPLNSVIAHVTWSPPANDGGAPITRYEVTLKQTLPARPDQTCVIDMTDVWNTPEGDTYPMNDDLVCDFPITPLVGPTDSYVIPQMRAEIRAMTDVGSTTTATPNIPPVARSAMDYPVQCDNPATVVPPATNNEYLPPDGVVSADEFRAWLTGENIPPANCSNPAVTFTSSGYTVHAEHPIPDRIGQPPPAVIDVVLVDKPAGDMPPVTVYVPSYSSLAQGRIHVDNPEAMDVDIVGGVLAAMFDIDDGRTQYNVDGTPVGGTVQIGYEAAAIQRKLEIVSTTNTTPQATSTAVVQINQNGAYAVNTWHIQ